MDAIKINPELSKITEKLFLGLELWQIGNLLLALAISVSMVLLLPDLGFIKGILTAVPAFPFVFISIKPIYGLKGLQLGTAIFYSLWNSKPLRYEASGWRGVNKNC